LISTLLFNQGFFDLFFRFIDAAVSLSIVGELLTALDVNLVFSESVLDTLFIIFLNLRLLFISSFLLSTNFIVVLLKLYVPSCFSFGEPFDLHRPVVDVFISEFDDSDVINDLEDVDAEIPFVHKSTMTSLIGSFIFSFDVDDDAD
jgi:hypothetical protein